MGGVFELLFLLFGEGWFLVFGLRLGFYLGLRLLSILILVRLVFGLRLGFQIGLMIICDLWGWFFVNSIGDDQVGEMMERYDPGGTGTYPDLFSRLFFCVRMFRYIAATFMRCVFHPLCKPFWGMDGGG